MVRKYFTIFKKYEQLCQQLYYTLLVQTQYNTYNNKTYKTKQNVRSIIIIYEQLQFVRNLNFLKHNERVKDK